MSISVPIMRTGLACLGPKAGSPDPVVALAKLQGSASAIGFASEFRSR